MKKILFVLFFFINFSVSQKIKGSGSTLAQVVHQKMANLYDSFNTVRSGTGIANLVANLYNFAGTDLVPAPSIFQQNPNFQLLPLMVGSIVIIYNIPELQPTDQLKIGRLELSKIFQQEITMWNDPSLVALNPTLNLPAKQILRIVRKDSSGTSSDFTTVLRKFDPTWPSVGSLPTWPNANSSIFFVSGSDAVSQSVQILDYSIAYNTYSSFLRIETKSALLENKNGKFVNLSDSVNSVSSSVQFDQYFSADISDEAGDDIYPLTVFTYLLYNNNTINTTNCNTQILLYKYLKTYYTPIGDLIMSQNGFYPIPDNIKQRINNVLDQMECNNQLILSLLNVDYNPLIIGLSVGVGGGILILLSIIGVILFVIFCKKETERKMMESLI